MTDDADEFRFNNMSTHEGHLHQNGVLTWFVCVEVLWPSQPNGVMLSAVSLPNHTFTGQVNRYCAHSFARN